MSQDWIIADVDDVAARQLAGATGLHRITARILINRGATEIDLTRRFLNPQLSDIPDPYLLPDMTQAISRIAMAIAKREQIAIYGDYDADGITGTAILTQFLREIGVSPIVALPSRFGEGYGLTPQAVAAFVKQGAHLIITIDNGTRAHEAIDYARSLDIDVVVTDHHEAGKSLPNAVAVVNPKCSNTPSSLASLAGCGVAFMLVLALRRHLRESGVLNSAEPNLRKCLDLVALGTIADAVDLTGVNRILVRHGLAEISKAERIGVRALIDVSATNPKAIRTNSVAFQLAPRLNAAGRLFDAQEALDLLLCSEAYEAGRLAQKLDEINCERQRIEEKILSEAMAIIDSKSEIKNHVSIVLASKGWHIGVIGIVAAKIAERSNRPTVIISLDSNPARGSARSFGTINISYALGQAGDHLVKFGGHAMAAGLSIEESAIDRFAECFEDICCGQPSSSLRSPLVLDALVTPHEITRQLVEEISSCHPFGAGNPEPLMLLSSMNVCDRRIVGNGHLKLKLRKEGITFDAIGFRMADALVPDASQVAIAFTPEFNTWNGTTSVQLKIKGIKSTSEPNLTAIRA